MQKDLDREEVQRFKELFLQVASEEAEAELLTASSDSDLLGNTELALRDLPPRLRSRRRTRPRKHGQHKISLTKRTGQKRGWQTVECTLYGEQTTKTTKTFLATYRPARGVIRAVLVNKEHGWFTLFCTDPAASVVEILEAFADRTTIKQDFHDVKEMWGAGQEELCDRSDSPWDDALRRPSRANRRKALRALVMQNE